MKRFPHVGLFVTDLWSKKSFQARLLPFFNLPKLLECLPRFVLWRVPQTDFHNLCFQIHPRRFRSPPSDVKISTQNHFGNGSMRSGYRRIAPGSSSIHSTPLKKLLWLMTKLLTSSGVSSTPWLSRRRQVQACAFLYWRQSSSNLSKLNWLKTTTYRGSDGTGEEKKWQHSKSSEKRSKHASLEWLSYLTNSWQIKTCHLTPKKWRNCHIYSAAVYFQKYKWYSHKFEKVKDHSSPNMTGRHIFC